MRAGSDNIIEKVLCMTYSLHSSLVQAADVIKGSGALHLRYLQTLSTVASEHNRTIVRTCLSALQH